MKTVKLSKVGFLSHTRVVFLTSIFLLIGWSSAQAVQPQVAAAYNHTVGLKSDGTVVAVGYGAEGQLNVSSWTSIVQVDAGNSFTVGLKSDGTVVAVGSNSYGLLNVGSWTDIVQVDAGNQFNVGLKSDGTVVAVGNNDWGQLNVGSWTDIVQVDGCYLHTVGLKSDGTVVAVGRNNYGQVDVSSWTDIVQVDGGGWHTVGLKSDGTVVAVGWNIYGQVDVSSWTDIVQVAAGYMHTVGLKSDGTVVAVGYGAYGQLNVSSWTDIVQVAPGYYHTVGLKSDGTVVAVGWNPYGQCNTPDWDLGALPNMPPIANAGLDQTIEHAILITLDGSGSSDLDGNYPLAYAWEIISKPVESNAILNNPDTVSPSFTPDVPGDYNIQLIVTDSLGLSSAPDTAVVSTTNTAPIGEAGPDQSITVVGSTVYLDGTESYDDAGDPFTFVWTISQRPAGSNANLSDATSPTPTFVADLHGDYIISLIVTDVFGAISQADTVTISFTNVKPVADVGGNQSVTVGSTVTLDGSESSDANNDPLTYQWSIVTKPAGSLATLSSLTSVQTSFTADKGGDYIISLVVNDSFVNSDPNNVTVIATSTQGQVIDNLNETITTINGFPAEVFKNANMSNASTNKIIAVIRLMEQGLYIDALDKLQNDILTKIDGCANEGVPDKNDWITDCAAQSEIYPVIIEVIGLLRD